MSVIDHKELAEKYLLSQYKQSPNLIELIDVFMGISNNIEIQAQKLFARFSFNIDTALEDELDKIGQILGVYRFPVQLPTNYFQFDVTTWDQYPFADDLGVTGYLIDDVRYRRALKAWIITHNSIGNTNDLITAIAYLFGIEFSDISITETNTNITITIAPPLETQDISMYNFVTISGSRLFPKIAGIGYTLIST